MVLKKSLNLELYTKLHLISMKKINEITIEEIEKAIRYVYYAKITGNMDEDSAHVLTLGAQLIMAFRKKEISIQFLNTEE